MKKNIFREAAKKLIDISFIPIKKSNTFLSYLFDHTLRDEMEKRSERGELFRHIHIYRSIRLARKLKNPGFTILDIGGGIGATAKIFRKEFPANKILIFEPINESFNSIRSLFQSDALTEVLRLAAGNENSKRQINVANRITSSSILPLSSDKDSKVFNEDNLGRSRIEDIEIVRLDDFLQAESDEIGIMKIDVQGFELDVLKGAEKTLRKTDIVVLEVNNHDGYSGAAKYHEIDSFFREHDFKLYDMFPSIVDNGRLKEWDVIYFNNDARCVSE
jgi:FkbM family methyltransferase